MTKQKLVEILKSLPITNPEIDQVKDLFPHLTADEICKLLNKPAYIAVPPLKVEGAFQIVSFIKRHKTSNGMIVPASLNYANTGSITQSHTNDRHSNHYDHLTEYHHINKAVRFAKENWSSDLSQDNWEDFIQIHLDDPTDLYDPGIFAGYPKTKAIISFTTTKKIRYIMNNRSKPQSQILDDAIAQITTDHHIACELRGDRTDAIVEFNCAYDGAGLDASNCRECGHTFKNDDFRTSWDTPLPAKIANHLIKEGFKFRKDPAIARQNEAEKYARQTNYY